MTRWALLIGLSVLLIGVGALAATGGAAASSVSYCDSVDANDSSVAAVVGDDVYTDEVRVYADSSLTLVYCEAGDPAERDWLDDGDGFEKSERDGHVYDVVFTGSVDSVDIGEQMVDEAGDVEAPVVTVTGDNTAERAGPFAAGTELAEAYESYQRSLDHVENETTALNETTQALEAGEVTASEANETVRALRTTYDDTTTARTDLLAQLKTASEGGNVTGAMSAAATIEHAHTQHESNVTAAANAYTGAITAAGDEPRSTVFVAALGALAGGFVIGGVAGVAVPLIAARRVKEKLKLSRDVNYDPKTALLPIVLGGLLLIAGSALLVVVIGIDPLVRVVA